ncbi:MAG: hypothetical protein FJ004_03320 [Chloroflexi bacterium]|nr:hypothetical protein [Chloroflexota bacterium]
MAETAKKPNPPGSKRMFGYIGLLAFLGGIILAIVGGAVSADNGGIVLALVIMGILVGVLNVTAKEVLPLLIAAIALIVVGGVGGGEGGFGPLDDLGGEAGTKINQMVAYLATFMAPAAVISAFRAVLALARPGD